MIFRVFVLWISISLLLGCKENTPIIPPAYQPTSAYDGYRHGLVEAGLGDSRLVEEWLTAGDKCLDAPTFIRLPYTEIVYFDDLHPSAFSYRTKTRRGQKIEAKLTSVDSLVSEAFLDLFQATSDTLQPYLHVASADSSMTLGFEPMVDGEYVLRLQPELLKQGRFRLEIKEVTVFAFPMSGRTETAILSLFGAERDAGRRIHEGNDIFAKRHHPIVAATSGVVSYAGEKGLGGKQIYIRDEKRGLALYFAHLENILVKEGDTITKGDTIATNGNSGNAATTNPHLHFGIYAESGAIDPYHYIVPNRRPSRDIQADPAWTGQLVRTRNKAYFDNVNYRYRNRRDSIPIHTIMTAHAAWSRSYRVALPDGREGYVRSGDLTLAETPYRSRKATDDLLVHRSITRNVLEGKLTAQEKYKVLGRFGGKEYVSQDDIQGWVTY